MIFETRRGRRGWWIGHEKQRAEMAIFVLTSGLVQKERPMHSLPSLVTQTYEGASIKQLFEFLAKIRTPANHEAFSNPSFSVPIKVCSEVKEV